MQQPPRFDPYTGQPLQRQQPPPQYLPSAVPGLDSIVDKMLAERLQAMSYGQPQLQPQSQFSPIMTASAAMVESEAEALNYPCEIGQTIILIMKDKSAFFEKAHAKNMKQPEIREYRLHVEDNEEFVMPQVVIPPQNNDELEKRLENIEKMLGVLIDGRIEPNTATDSTIHKPISENNEVNAHTERGRNGRFRKSETNNGEQ